MKYTEIDRAAEPFYRLCGSDGRADEGACEEYGQMPGTSDGAGKGISGEER